MIFQIIAVGILGAVLALLVKKERPEFSMIIAIVSGAIIVVMILPMLTEAMGFLRHIGGMADGIGEYAGLALRVIGVAYMAELGASVCNDANETAIAAKIDLAGRVIILVMAMPVIADIVRIVTGLL
ncbi:MAG: stage III sporulation AC/AD family protein [Defluviitaleaceae bacterium]|nr:stage III sporulation AC/AD family protein [Defluviitaleaceae bacterium]